MNRFLLLLLGALLLSTQTKISGANPTTHSPPNIQEGIAALPIDSTNETLSYATNSVTAIYLAIEFEDPDGWIEYEGKTWSQFDSTGFAWRAATSEVSLGKTVEQSLRDWLNYNINVLKSFNPANPDQTYFRVAAVCDANTDNNYPDYYAITALFQSYKVFRLVKKGSEYVVPDEASKGSLQYWPLVFEQVDIIVPGLDWARVETSTEVMDTRDFPNVSYNFRGRLFNGNSRNVLNFPSKFVGTKTPGKVTLQYISGAEQEFDLATGRPLNFKPLSLLITRRYKDKISIVVEATPTKQHIILLQSTNLPMWNELLPFTNTTGLCVFNLPTNYPPKFFRAVERPHP